jgi:hypothetical protein
MAWWLNELGNCRIIANLALMESLNTTSSTASFHSKGFRYPFWPSILLIMQFGMLAMFASFAIGVPAIISVFILLGAFVVGIGLIGGYTSYFLNSDGIVQEVSSFNWMPIKMKPVTRSFKWSDIKSYKIGSDLSRSLQRYNYLYISVRKMPYQLRLSDDQSDKIALQNFTALFEQSIEKEAAANEIFSTAFGNQPAHLLRKPDFYHTKFAHLLFWLFMFVIAWIAWAIYTTGNLKGSYVWRFSVIIIPGMSYFAYRLYFQRNK